MNRNPSPNDERWKRFEELRDAALNGRISPAEMETLESFVLGDAAMRRNYAEHVHQQAALRLSVAPAIPAISHALVSGEPNIPDDANIMKPTAESTAEPSRWSRTMVHAMSIAAATLMAVGLTYSFTRRDSSQQIAMITSSEDCKWGDCTLATTERMPLGAGTLRLESGIATLRFPNVNVTMEGRVELRIVGPKQCYVSSGRVFANVEPGGEGFIIQTPTASFVDRGTTFGVRVGPAGTSDLTVFKGRVDVSHLSTEAEAVARVNERVRASSDGLLEVGKGDFPSDNSTLDESIGLPIHISTASGAGDDAYLSAGEVTPANTSTTALLVKEPARSKPSEWYARWRRKAFLRMDISGVNVEDIAAATLQLHGVATNIGFSSMMPDATFSVHGLVDESQDDWDSRSMTWLNCPANAGDTIDVDKEATMFVGSFVVPQSSPEGRFEIAGEKLLDFLQADSNGRVTFILLPETVGEEGQSYVHGFASKRHPFLAAPTLRLRVK